MNGQRLKIASPAPNAPLKPDEENNIYLLLLSQKAYFGNQKHTYRRTLNVADASKHSVGHACNERRPKSPVEQ
jgi:hypothetical protein